MAEAWTDSFRRRLGGLRASTAIREFVLAHLLEAQFDYVFYKYGPEISVLSIGFLFSTPTTSSFLLRATSFRGPHTGTLGETLKRWLLRDAQTIASLAPDATSCLSATPRFLGYIPQRFKTYGQTMSHEASRYLRQIRKRVYENVSAVLRSVNPTLAPKPSVDPIIGQVKDFASLVQISQREGVPLWDCSSTLHRPKGRRTSRFGKLHGISPLRHRQWRLTDRRGHEAYGEVQSQETR